MLSLSHMRRFLLCRASRPFAVAECLQGADAGRDVLESCSSGTRYGQAHRVGQVDLLCWCHHA
jgi:hypothetical protein